MSPRSTGKKAKNSKPLCPLDESIAISPISDTGWDVLLIGAARLFAQVRWNDGLGVANFNGYLVAVQRGSSADGKKRSFLTVGWSGLLAGFFTDVPQLPDTAAMT